MYWAYLINWISGSAIRRLKHLRKENHPMGKGMQVFQAWLWKKHVSPGVEISDLVLGLSLWFVFQSSHSLIFEPEGVKYKYKLKDHFNQRHYANWHISAASLPMHKKGRKAYFPTLQQLTMQPWHFLSSSGSTIVNCGMAPGGCSGICEAES